MNNYASSIIGNFTTNFSGYDTFGNTELSGTDVIDLAVGQIDLPHPTWIKDAIVRGSCEAPLGYINPKGLARLRTAYSNFLSTRGFQVNEENILVTSGGKESLWLSFINSISTGDTVVIPEPGWPPYSMWAHAFGAKVVTYDPLRANVAQVIMSLINEYAPSVLVLNFPNNPTGAEMTEQSLLNILEHANLHNVTVISDEVYREFNINQRRTSSLRYLGNHNHQAKVVYVDSLTKMLGLAGIRVGFLISNPALVKQMRMIRASIASCVSSVSQLISSYIFEDPLVYSWIDQIVDHTHQMASYMASKFSERNYEIHGRGAIYLWIKHSQNTTPLNLGNQYISLHGHTVKVSPGSIFGHPEYFRLCVSKPQLVIESLFQPKEQE